MVFDVVLQVMFVLFVKKEDVWLSYEFDLVGLL